MGSNRPKQVLAIFLAAGCAGGCASLRPLLGLCHENITPEMKAEQSAAQRFTEVSFEQELQRRGLVKVHPQYQQVHSSDAGTVDPEAYVFRYPELMALGPDDGPVFARDAQGIVHPILIEPHYIESRSYELCICEPPYEKGVTPGEILRIYKIENLGPAIAIKYDAKAVTFRRNLCPHTGPPRV